MAILVHGTTRHRARMIVAAGPRSDFIEPGGRSSEDGFSTFLEFGPFLFGTPQEYACRKAVAFPSEGGAVILVMDVPDDIIALAVDETYLPLSQGLVQFDSGAGLEELQSAWRKISKHIVSVICP